jgi:hypothetical protein
VWGKKQKVRSPKTGRRVYKPRPEADWVRTQNEFLVPFQRYVMAQFEVEMKKGLESKAGEISVMRDRKIQLESKITNLVAVLAMGLKSPTIVSELAKLEGEVAEIADSLSYVTQEFLPSQIDRMRDRAKARIKDLLGLLYGDVAVARNALLKHVEKIVLRPSGKFLVASGTWNLLEQIRTGGAGGQNRTGYARLFRAALYQ